MKRLTYIINFPITFLAFFISCGIEPNFSFNKKDSDAKASTNGMEDDMLSVASTDRIEYTQARTKAVPVTVLGRTHLVRMRNNSVMDGENSIFVKHGESLHIEPSVRIISRRGPNQELVGDYDKRGECIYRWYRVKKYNGENIEELNAYIREKTFVFDNPESEPEQRHNLAVLPDKRTRQSHIAIRFELYLNTDRKIDSGGGHLIMADKSQEYEGKKFYYAYEMGEKRDMGEPEGEKTKMDIEGSQPELQKGSKSGMYTGISVIDARNGKRLATTFKTLEQKNESKKDAQSRMQNKTVYVSKKTGVGYIRPREDRIETKRFNKKKWIEFLITREEYDYLMSMWEVRKENGFYCFIREARTTIGYQYATRCLSSLEDIALRREQYGLKAGRAEDILEHFKFLNNITDKHEGQEDV